MNSQFVIDTAREGIITILLVTAPVLGTGLAVGLLVSIFQATTQIQEPTLAFVPKIAAVLISIYFFGNWILRMVINFTLNLWQNLGVPL